MQMRDSESTRCCDKLCYSFTFGFTWSIWCGLPDDIESCPCTKLAVSYSFQGPRQPGPHSPAKAVEFFIEVVELVMGIMSLLALTPARPPRRSLERHLELF